MLKETDKLFNNTAKDLKISLLNPNLIDLLALQCIMCVRTNDKSLPHLVKNKLCQADTLIFTAFFIRAKCMAYAANVKVADLFDDRYMPHIANALNKYFLKSPDIANKMLNNRINLYNDLYIQNNTDDQQTILFEEFSYIITMDGQSSSYQEYSKNPPWYFLVSLIDVILLTKLMHMSTAFLLTSIFLFLKYKVS